MAEEGGFAHRAKMEKRRTEKMKLCDRCRVSGCCLNYLGDACKRARKRECPDVVFTNADRIRDMSDEELLNFMIKTIGNAVLCKTLGTEPKFCSLEWLQQPAEEK